MGSLAYDAVARDHDDPGLLSKLAGWSVVLMALGYGFSCLGGYLAPPPFVPPAAGHVVDLWTMSQRTGSVAYLTFSAGFSLAVYALFVVFCDRVGLAIRAVSDLRSKCPGGVHHPLDRRRRRQAVPARTIAGLVRRRGVWRVFRDLHALEPLPRKALAISEALKLHPAQKGSWSWFKRRLQHRRLDWTQAGCDCRLSLRERTPFRGAKGDYERVPAHATRNGRTL